jgi:diguanylate cyclase
MAYISGSTSAAVDADYWRIKASEAAKALDQQSRDFRNLENVLRRVIARLCIAGSGRTAPLDAILGRLSSAPSSKMGTAELEALFLPLADAVVALDQRPVGSAVGEGATLAPDAQPISGDADVRRVLARVLDAVGRDTRLVPLVTEIQAQIAVPVLDGQLPLLLSDIADLVIRRINSVEAEKAEVEDLLAQITLRLDDLTEFLLGETEAQRESFETNAAFNSQLVSNVQDLGSSVEAAKDLDQARATVRARILNIDMQMDEFRNRENERNKSFRDRSEEMRSRLEVLEGETRNLQERLRDEQRISMVDGLTQIPNRSACDRRMVEEFKRWQRFGTQTSIAVWDIDLFKQVNDTYGHRAGDKVLRIVAEKLNAQIRQTDFLARYGGEEFVLILAGTPPVNAIQVTEKLRASIAELGFHFKGQKVQVTLSCGVTDLRSGDLLEEAFERADKALYAAKSAGRNRCIQD